MESSTATKRCGICYHDLPLEQFQAKVGMRSLKTCERCRKRAVDYRKRVVASFKVRPVATLNQAEISKANALGGKLILASSSLDSSYPVQPGVDDSDRQPLAPEPVDGLACPEQAPQMGNVPLDWIYRAIPVEPAICNGDTIPSSSAVKENHYDWFNSPQESLYGQARPARLLLPKPQDANHGMTHVPPPAPARKPARLRGRGLAKRTKEIPTLYQPWQERIP